MISSVESIIQTFPSSKMEKESGQNFGNRYSYLYEFYNHRVKTRGASFHSTTDLVLMWWDAYFRVREQVQIRSLEIAEIQGIFHCY